MGACGMEKAWKKSTAHRCVVTILSILSIISCICDEIIPVDGVTVTPESAYVMIGYTVSLSATISPGNASNTTVIWSSSASGVASVESGTVTGIAAGTATITATTQDGGYEDTCFVTVTEPPPYFLYAVCSTQIWAFSGNADDGSLTAASGSPFDTPIGAQSIAVDPLGRYIYVATSISTPTVSGYRVSALGSLTEVPGSPVAFGNNAVAFSGSVVDPSGHYLYIANEGSNHLFGWSIDQSTGELAALSGSPYATGSYPEGIVIDPLGEFAYVCNLTGNVSGYRIIDSGALSSLTGSPFAVGSGLRTAAMTPDGGRLYVSSEGDTAIYAFSVDRDTGMLTPIPGSPFTATYCGTQDCVMDPLGRFLFVTRTGYAGIFVWSIDADTGALTPVDGSLFTTGDVAWDATIDPSGSFLYVVNSLTNCIAAYRIETTGALTAIVGSPFSTGTNPNAVAVLDR